MKCLYIIVTVNDVNELNDDIYLKIGKYRKRRHSPDIDVNHQFGWRMMFNTFMTV